MATRREVNQYLATTGLPVRLCRSIDMLAKQDPELAMEQARHEADKLGAQQVQASAPRRARRPVTEIVAAAVAQGRIGVTSVDYWTERMTSAPRETEKLLTASVEDGGLYAVGRVPAAPVISPEQEARDHERAFAASFPRQASALGYAPRASSPFTVEAPEPRVRRPGRAAVVHIRDNAN